MEDRWPPTARQLGLLSLIAFLVLAITISISRYSAAAGDDAHRFDRSRPEAGAAENRPPEMEAVRFKRAGVGQRLFFGIAVIDEETDDIRVEVTQKPASA